MTNFINGKKLITEAERIARELDALYNECNWNLTVRRAQEVVELSLKALLKMMGIDYPKHHDAGKLFAEAVKQKGLVVDSVLLDEIKTSSKWLAGERAPAFYYEKEYTEDKARKAKEYADKVLNFGRRFSSVLNSEHGRC